jgi:hypothetical protein
MKNGERMAVKKTTQKEVADAWRAYREAAKAHWRRPTPETGVALNRLRARVRTLEEAKKHDQ